MFFFFNIKYIFDCYTLDMILNIFLMKKRTNKKFKYIICNIFYIMNKMKLTKNKSNFCLYNCTCLSIGSQQSVKHNDDELISVK